MPFAPGRFILLTGGIKGGQKIRVLIDITRIAAGGDLKMFRAALRRALPLLAPMPS